MINNIIFVFNNLLIVIEGLLFLNVLPSNSYVVIIVLIFLSINQFIRVVSHEPFGVVFDVVFWFWAVWSTRVNFDDVFDTSFNFHVMQIRKIIVIKVLLLQIFVLLWILNLKTINISSQIFLKFIWICNSLVESVVHDVSVDADFSFFVFVLESDIVFVDFCIFGFDLWHLTVCSGVFFRESFGS